MAVIPAFQLSGLPGIAPETLTSLVIKILPDDLPVLTRNALAAPSLSTLANEPAIGFPTT